MQEWEQYPDTQTSSLVSVLQVLDLGLLMVMSGPHDEANKIFVYLYNLRSVFAAQTYCVMCTLYLTIHLCARSYRLIIQWIKIKFGRRGGVS